MFCLGFEVQINSSKALADEALSKLPIISRMIGKAAANNDATQAILDQLGDYNDAQATLTKLSTSLAKVEVGQMDISFYPLRYPVTEFSDPVLSANNFRHNSPSFYACSAFFEKVFSLF